MGKLDIYQHNLRELLQTYAVQNGDFTLSSGICSSYFIDATTVTLSPDGAEYCGELLYDRMLYNGLPDAVGGLALGAVPLIMAVTMASRRHFTVPGFIVRDVAKDHGLTDRLVTSKSYDGRPLLSPARRVAIVDDVATSGNSCLDAIREVERSGAQVSQVLVLVDRQQGADRLLRSRGYFFDALFVANESGSLISVGKC